MREEPNVLTKKYLERFLIRPVTARVRRNEDEQTQSLSPSQVLKDKIHTPSDRRKLEARLARGGG